MRINLKLILIIGAFAVGILAGVLFTVSGLVNRNVRKDILSNFQQQQRSLNQMQTLVYDRLVESCYLIGQNSTFKANVSLQDTATVREAILEFGDMVKVDVIIVTDPNGIVLNALGPVGENGEDLSLFSGIKEALSGDLGEGDFQDMMLWKGTNYLFQVVSTPITTNSELLGTLTLGMALTDYEADQLKAEVSTDVHFIKDKQVVASTLSGLEREKLPLFLELLDYSEEEQFQLIQLDGQEYFISLSPLGQEEGCWLMCSVPKTDAMDLIFQIRDKMWVIGLVAFIIAMLIAWLIGNNISKPILKMVSTLGDVQRGNLDTSIELKGGLEFKMLSGAFNEMVEGLKERLRLEKYVGDHTRAQVKTVDGGSPVSLEACVMFSDIRGFTALSSKLDPETVIQLLNRWLGFQTDIVHQYGGIVDKFVGDEIMAIFRGKDCIAQGVACAREIQKRVPEFMDEYAEEVALGIGLNFGSMVMGNIGVSNRMDYTVIGSVVNLSARLCSAAKAGEILIPVEIYKTVHQDVDQFTVREMRFKGVAQLTEVINVAEFESN